LKPFRFRLEKVLNIRQRESMLAKNALAQARLRTRQAVAFLETSRSERAASEQALLVKRMKRMTTYEWIISTQMHESLVEREKQAMATLQNAEQEEAYRRELLAEAERREKVLDKLKERQEGEHRYQAEAYEQAQIDEMAQNIFREGGGRR